MERLCACDHSHLLHQLTQILEQIGNLGHSLETVSIIFQDFYFLVLFYHTEFMGKGNFRQQLYYSAAIAMFLLTM